MILILFLLIFCWSYEYKLTFIVLKRSTLIGPVAKKSGTSAVDLHIHSLLLTQPQIKTNLYSVFEAWIFFFDKNVRKCEISKSFHK